ncbi:unnamed protein product [Schistosoma curassoni]|uniref:Uncharacterized protein n=1 Tax=Schistosoma curassoni TaxID=6186 RepID=A0A183KG63_9TREM|nr:unnamed protein product [Schistosoma curassoni]
MYKLVHFILSLFLLYTHIINYITYRKKNILRDKKYLHLYISVGIYFIFSFLSCDIAKANLCFFTAAKINSTSERISLSGI